MFMTNLTQTIPLPDTFEALLWVIITALVGVVVYLFRQLRKAEERNLVFQTELLGKTLAGLGENSEAMRELAMAMKVLEEHFSIRKEIESLRREIRNEPNN